MGPNRVYRPPFRDVARAHTFLREEIVGADEGIVFFTVVIELQGSVCDCDHLSILGMRERDGDLIFVAQC